MPLWQPASVVFLNACANVHCVNACVCFEANKYSSKLSSLGLLYMVTVGINMGDKVRTIRIIIRIRSWLGLSY